MEQNTKISIKEPENNHLFTEVSPNLLINTLNVNGLTSLINRQHRVAEWSFKITQKYDAQKKLLQN
jgi:hypothetical protein